MKFPKRQHRARTARCTRCGKLAAADTMVFAIAKPVGHELRHGPEPEKMPLEEARKRGFQLEQVCPTCWEAHPEPRRIERV